MDKMKGGYSAAQALFGSIGEFNLWSKVITEDEIQNMARSAAFLKGNVISWEKENFVFHDVSPQYIANVETYFVKNKAFVIFARRQLLSVANETCASYGGNIATPESTEENEELLRIFSEHSSECSDDDLMHGEYQMAIWLGMMNFGLEWFKLNDELKMVHTKYSNWTGSNWEKFVPGMCAYIKKDGFWAAEKPESCKFLRLCTICMLPKTPVFSLKGLCTKGSYFQWQYYPSINASNEIDKFEGFKRFQNISIHDDTWKTTVGCESLSAPMGKSIAGRGEWDWHESSCTNGKTFKTNLTFSSCEVGIEFTCNFGRCIDIAKRCDNIKDCNDGSDEEDCTTIDIPQFYEKLEPPRSGTSGPLVVNVSVVIENINDIDTKQMMIDTTMKITMKWKDGRLKFRNLPCDRPTLITSFTSNKLWLPSENLVYENEIVGNEYTDKSEEFSVRTNSSPLPFDVCAHREELIYDGQETEMKITKRIRIKTTCNFRFTKFPFDNQECQFVMYIKHFPLRNVELIGTPNAVQYIGGTVIGQFQINMIPTSILDENRDNRELHHAFSFTIELARDSGDGLKMIIFPSLVLWLLAFLTLRIDVEDLTNRNRTSVTALLVLVTLFGAISNKDDFPQTSGFKYIDVWFLWYLICTFLIICHHVILSNIVVIENEDSAITRVQPIQCRDETNFEKLSKSNARKKELVNKIVNIFFLLAMIIFNSVYFSIAT
jgi:hypothetical protein